MCGRNEHIVTIFPGIVKLSSSSWKTACFWWRKSLFLETSFGSLAKLHCPACLALSIKLFGAETNSDHQDVIDLVSGRYSAQIEHYIRIYIVSRSRTHSCELLQCASVYQFFRK